jgi:hypothetical protein
MKKAHQKKFDTLTMISGAGIIFVPVVPDFVLPADLPRQNRDW